MVELVDGEHGGGRVVDRGRQRLRGNVDDDPECERRVLLHGPFRPDRDGLLKIPIVDVAASVQAKQRVSPRHEVTDLGNHFDQAVPPPSQRGKPRRIEGQHDAGAEILDGAPGVL